MSENYILPREYLESNRLNLHHYLLRETFGYLLHPSIPTGDPKLRVADVGTGTGIWLTDLSHQLPSGVRLDGLDISIESVPPKQWLPANVTFRQWDIHSDIPQDLVGVYDIIHISLLIFVIKNENVPAVMGRLLKLLKPGGYLQWLETDASSFRIQKASPDNKIEALTKLINLLSSSDNTVFRENGFTGVQYDARNPLPEMVMPLHECNLLVHENMARKTNNTKWSEAINRILPGVLTETQAGAAYDFTRVVVVGKKPLE
ncbi:hypothetical protein N7456_001383 [Penicillium angulare]|uniref:Methyltransferase domain-containing protein n=1 Tax=Penicillium angulare TaxID=116970 RepID=A0A9W9KT07_9EURO|nr:hypothetical protein N7456_001383 [Penicillium angulare]